MAAEPLRPIPSTPARTITATNTITAVAFADTAGAALITTLQSSLEIIDLGTDSVIFRDATPGPFEHSAALSPNGRVFSALHGNDGTRLRESATGEVLLDMPEFSRFMWLDSTTAWVTRRGQGKELLDLPTGKSALSEASRPRRRNCCACQAQRRRPWRTARAGSRNSASGELRMDRK